jgi:hypothetical protein
MVGAFLVLLALGVLTAGIVAYRHTRLDRASA